MISKSIGLRLNFQSFKTILSEVSFEKWHVDQTHGFRIATPLGVIFADVAKGLFLPRQTLPAHTHSCDCGSTRFQKKLIPKKNCTS